ncbi:MAG: hypothetical protein QG588_730 [Candidatus Poribacteria bacterium]|nr:hypothetical protein [Candidatus Poribacteria bacterium]
MGSANTIDVSDLSDEELKMVENFIKLLKTKTKIEMLQNEGKIKFSTRKSNVIGLLTREEIYDYL